MKKKYILLFSICCLLVGCNQIEGAVEDDSDCLVSFNLFGEISASSIPLTKSSTDDLYLVQVYRGNDPFASGVFDNCDDIKMYLKKGSNKYRIIFSMIRNGKIILGDNYSSANNSIKVTSFAELRRNTNYTPIGFGENVNGDTFAWLQEFGPYSALASTATCWLAINSLYYNSVDSYKFYSGPTNTEYFMGHRQTSADYNNKSYDNSLQIKFINIQRAKINNIYPQCDDWFYGEIIDYSPTGEYETLNLDLKRVGFKLKYELSGVTDGEVTVKVYKDTKTFINKTTNTSTYSSEPQFYAFYEARNAWLYADEYMENMTLAVSWKRGIGVTEDYGTKTIQIKRNCLNNIKIQMTSADQTAGMNLTVEAESTIGAEAVTIPVE